ncbi:CvpA family protein [Alienimonas californiensis]|uniref:Colicin V production protein n=1 Tax=Alienimonas californiensis TaxID=2527989 RepID=A0A517PEA4_9PLAN|nr:CvpA family protein [Alienimonas californiensis]QDT17703.1 hypothetical protein CA12_38340 [Alienimonas californiensis]
MIDLILLALWGGVTYFVANEGALGAVTTFFCVVLSGLLAMNFFEPLAEAIGGSDFLRERADVICLLGLFAAFVTGMRLACEQIAPRLLELPAPAYHGLRWVFGAATGYVTMAILLTALHVSPLPRTFLGFAPERGFSKPGGNLFDVDAPDRRWLAFTRYVSLNPLKKGGGNRLEDGNGTLLNTLSGFDNRTGYGWDAVTSDGSHAATKSMPSFVIRYADRRANGAGAAPAAPAAPAPGAQRSTGPAF